MAAPVRIPTLTTDKIQLVPFGKSHFEAQVGVLSRPETQAYTDVPSNPSPKDLMGVCVMLAKQNATGTGRVWAIVPAGGQTPVGTVRLTNLDGQSLTGTLGFEVHPDFWGKGLATEAVKAVTGFAHQRMGVERIEAWTMPGNTASERVLVKAGYQHEGTMRGKGRFKGKRHDLSFYGRLSTDPYEVQ